MANEVTTYEEDIGIQVPNMMMVLMMIIMVSVVITMLPSLAQQVQVQAYQLQAQAYQGRTDPRTVQANSNLKWLDVSHDFPYAPWISAYFVNDGPDPVWVAINYPDDKFVINPKETNTVERTGAQERIAIIFYVCERGKKASLRITGEY